MNKDLPHLAHEILRKRGQEILNLFYLALNYDILIPRNSRAKTSSFFIALLELLLLQGLTTCRKSVWWFGN